MRAVEYCQQLVIALRSEALWKSGNFGFEIFNLGESQTVSLSRMIELLEAALGKKAIMDRQPLQPGDVPITFADISKSREKIGAWHLKQGGEAAGLDEYRKALAIRAKLAADDPKSADAQSALAKTHVMTGYLQLPRERIDVVYPGDL